MNVLGKPKPFQSPPGTTGATQIRTDISNKTRVNMVCAQYIYIYRFIYGMGSEKYVQLFVLLL